MKRVVRNEDGVSLILAMAFLALFSIAIAAVLSLANTNVSSTALGFRQVRAVDYAAQGSVNGAIQSIRGNLDQGVAGSACPTFNVTNANGQAVSVTCTPTSTSGSGGKNQPKNAILTLGTDASEGVLFAGNKSVAIDGAVDSNSNICLDGSGSTCKPLVGNNPQETVSVFGDVFARSGSDDCTSSNLTSSLPVAPHTAITKNCNWGTKPDPNGSDPGYLIPDTQYPAATSAPAAAPAPTCADITGSSWQMDTFSPGKYTVSPNVLAGTAIAAAQSAHPAKCNNNKFVFYFSPGVYYFSNVAWDLGAPNPPALPNNPTIDIVAGTLGSWTTTPPDDGTACDASKVGDLFVMGGSSHLTLPNLTETETFCAGWIDANGALDASAPNQNGQAIAIYGVTAAASVASGGTYSTESGCATSAPYIHPGSASACAIFGADTNVEDKPDVFIHGTTYAPLAAVDFTLHQSSNTILDRGIVARTLYLYISASSNQSTSPFSIPTCTSGCRADREVIFVATVPGATPPTRLRTDVTYNDQHGATPGLSLTVNHWSSSGES